MKTKHIKIKYIIQCDYMKISGEVFRNTNLFEKIKVDFINKPIVLKDKRRKPKYYKVEYYGEEQNNSEDFIKDLYTIMRRIVYKHQLLPNNSANISERTVLEINPPIDSKLGLSEKL